jgi:hypothetical protein
VGQLGGQVVGQRLGAHARGGWRERADRTAGAMSGLVAVVAAVWLLTPTLSDVPDWPARQARGSLLVTTIDDITPNPPDPLETLSGLVSDEQWDRILQQAGPGEIGPPPEAVALSTDAVALARRATVRVEHRGCPGGALDGTGFVAAPHYVVTNAHVVAGRGDAGVTVYQDDRHAGYPARVVHFDPDQDLAVLYVETLDADPLPFGKTAPGTRGLVFGHPGGGPLAARPFSIASVDRLQTGDIYDQDPGVERDVVFVASQLERGDSGSALVDQEGRVVGVAWAVAKDNNDVALATTADEAKAALTAAQAAVAAGPAIDLPAGRCLAFD